jgi:hypothetical protein
VLLKKIPIARGWIFCDNDVEIVGGVGFPKEEGDRIPQSRFGRWEVRWGVSNQRGW